MTHREEQILSWIREDPMISQERLAEKAGITRSSVAVHISNLMKKGCIVGKGYVLRENRYAVVVGGVNMDIGGRSFAPLVAMDSNPGRVTTSLGGVGRNIAHNLRLLGAEVHLLTALGDDMQAKRIIASCAELGISLRDALEVPNGRTPTYLFLNDADGDMALALSDMEICEQITPAYLESKLPLLNKASVVIADCNIPRESLEFLAEHCTAPLFADPVSTAKAKKLLPILGKIHTLKPNRLEAELLTGISITDTESLHRAAKSLLAAGTKRVFISLGIDGTLAAEGDTLLQIPCCPAKVRNATGAGDSFMAALARSYMDNSDLEQSARFAAATAALAIESEETINPQISTQAVLNKMANP